MSATPATICCDISHRGRLRLTGEDRVRFLNGQATNDIAHLPPGRGCYAAFANAKGKMRGDAVILNTGDALLLDVEPGADQRLMAELEKFVIADDVTIENLTNSWSAWTVIGAGAAEALRLGGLCPALLQQLFEIAKITAPDLSGAFLFRSRRAIHDSFDLWTEKSRRALMAERLTKALESVHGSFEDADALEILRVEAGIPRFGAEMDENTLPPEAGLESTAISYTKGCYIGQEVISRIKSMGHVNRTLVRLRLPPSAEAGQPLALENREVGRLGSAVTSPRHGRIGLAVVRREAAQPGTRLALPQNECMVVENFTP